MEGTVIFKDILENQAALHAVTACKLGIPRKGYFHFVPLSRPPVIRTKVIIAGH